MNEPLFVASGADAPRADLPFVERQAITALVRNPKNNTYLALRWKEVVWETFLTGGVEEGQTPEQAARAEVQEESGYMHLRLVCELPKYHAQFFHAPKGVNRFAHFTSFLFELEDDIKIDIAPEEAQKHECVWLAPHELGDFNLPEGHRFLWDQVQQQGL